MASKLLFELFAPFGLELFEFFELVRTQNFSCVFMEIGLDSLELFKFFQLTHGAVCLKSLELLVPLLDHGSQFLLLVRTQLQLFGELGKLQIRKQLSHCGKREAEKQNRNQQ